MDCGTVGVGLAVRILAVVGVGERPLLLESADGGAKDSGGVGSGFPIGCSVGGEVWLVNGDGRGGEVWALYGVVVAGGVCSSDKSDRELCDGWVKSGGK